MKGARMNRPPLLFPPVAMALCLAITTICLLAAVQASPSAVTYAAAMDADQENHMPLTAQWWIQLGFLGAFALAMYVLFWLIKARRSDWQTWMSTLLDLHRETNRSLKQNTVAFVEVNGTLTRLCEKLTVEEDYSRRVYECLVSGQCRLAARCNEEQGGRSDA